MVKMANKSIVFGGGCFWCTEAVFELFPGVKNIMPGYAGGKMKGPTYEDVCTDTTGHAEVVRIEYDDSQITFDQLLKIFFAMHDPTSLNRQGADTGTQYRSIILYNNDDEKRAINAFVNNAQKGYSNKIVTEVKKLDVFYPAEDYHKKYYDNNPSQAYCNIVIGPKVAKIKKEFGLS